MKKLLFPGSVFVVTVAWMVLQKPVFMLLYAVGEPCMAWWQVVWHGVSLDCTVAGYFTTVPLLITLLSVWFPMPQRTIRVILTCYFSLVSICVAAAFAGNLALYKYWGFPLDGSIFIYLSDPREAAASAAWSEVAIAIATFALAAATLISSYVWLTRRFYDGYDPHVTTARRISATLLTLLATGVDLVSVRGGVTVATANVSSAYFSNDMVLNHAAVNPTFSVIASTIDLSNNDYTDAYPFFEEEERERIFSEIRGNRADAPDTTDTRPDTLRLLNTQRPNVVLVLLESFGRGITDAAPAGQPVTPQLNRLKNEGVWFENFYANSFRTDRGEVSILSGFPAQTSMSIMKLPRQSASLPSIARSLTASGYHSLFVYGGDLNFTNQASYMYATGWKELLWQKDMTLDAPTSKWGYADDVVGRLFGDRVINLDAQSKPFLAGWLTLSSHEPFDVPTSTFDDPLLNAMHFTDMQVGMLIDRLKASPAWKDLLVILVADHGYPYPDGVAYSSPERHHIPMLWLGGALRKPLSVDTYGSQIDLCATLLGQMGLPHAEYDFSKDMFGPGPHFGYYTFSDGFGVVDSSGVTIHDNTSGRILSPLHQLTPQHISWGKALLQTTYCDISKR